MLYRLPVVNNLSGEKSEILFNVSDLCLYRLSNKSYPPLFLEWRVIVSGRYQKSALMDPNAVRGMPRSID